MIKLDNKKYLKSLDQLKTDCKIYIFGSGTIARSFLFSLKAYRHDIEILGFINSFKSGELFGHPIIRVNDFRNLSQNYDHVIICTDTIHWYAIMGKLMENSISEFFVNLYWDFNLYGQKNNKIRINKKIIHQVRKMFNSNNDVEIFDIITESIKLQHIEKSLIYWQGKKDKRMDYSKYINLKKGDIVINGGAAFPTEAEWFSKQVGKQGKVFNIDPNINNAKLKNEKAASNAINFQIVLWNKTTKVSFRMDGSRSMVVDNNNDHLQVKATSIDDFVSTQNLTKIDFIKLDVEGAEPNVLRGGGRIY